MPDVALPSAFSLTFLLFIGLTFFIRASTKDRTEQAQYLTDLNDVELMTALQDYFAKRAYQVTQVDETTGQISLVGMVQASPFLAVFLGLLAAIGLLCLALVVTIAIPDLGSIPYGLLLLAPLASVFYWKGATRPESVVFRLLSSETEKEGSPKTALRIRAHRDELAVLESKLPLKRQGVE